jgi:hypothetical protein
MSLGAWITLVVGSVVLYGGLIYCILLSRARGSKMDLDAPEEADEPADAENE